MKNRRGFTLIEIVITMAIMALVMLTVVELVMPLTRFFQRGRLRQQATAEARLCLETVQRVMSNGRASTLVVTTSLSTPSTQIQFQGVDGSSYTITWSTAPANSIHLQVTPPNSAVTTDRLLTTHATHFALTGDLNDPSAMNLSLQITVALDATGSPDSFLNIYFPSQMIHMIGT